MNVIILGFDGVLADTLELRARALAMASVEFGVHPVSEKSVGRLVTRLVRQLPGRSLTRLARAIVGNTAAADPTLVELVALHAQRAISQRMRQGVDISPLARMWLEQQALRGVRVVLRSDSIRADVDRTLRMFELEALFGFVHCADDPIAATVRGAFAGTLKRSYASITDRLDGREKTSDRVAYESGDYATSIASAFVTRAARADRSLFAT
jgi:beta-phosphoglucomutase-like phosphatase (HAD superfamily)